MWRLLISIIICSKILAQVGPTQHIAAGPTLPAACSILTGDVWMLTTGVTGQYNCNSLGQWGLIGATNCASGLTLGNVLVGGGAGNCATADANTSLSNGDLTLSPTNTSATVATLNATSPSFNGNILDLQVNGASQFKVNQAGVINASGAGYFGGNVYVNGQTTSYLNYGGGYLQLVEGGQSQMTFTGNTVAAMKSSGVFGFTSGVANQSPDTAFSRDSAGVMDCGTGAQGSKICTLQASAFTAGTSITTPFIQSTGTKFTITGCSAGTTVGGAAAGSFLSGTTGACTVVITINGATGATATNGWTCSASDLTTPANLISQSASSTTTCTITGTTVSGDKIQFMAMGF